MRIGSSARAALTTPSAPAKASAPAQREPRTPLKNRICVSCCTVNTEVSSARGRGSPGTNRLLGPAKRAPIDKTAATTRACRETGRTAPFLLFWYRNAGINFDLVQTYEADVDGPGAPRQAGGGKNAGGAAHRRHRARGASGASR